MSGVGRSHCVALDCAIHRVAVAIKTWSRTCQQVESMTVTTVPPGGPGQNAARTLYFSPLDVNTAALFPLWDSRTGWRAETQALTATQNWIILNASCAKEGEVEWSHAGEPQKKAIKSAGGSLGSDVQCVASPREQKRIGWATSWWALAANLASIVEAELHPGRYPRAGKESLVFTYIAEQPEIIPAFQTLKPTDRWFLDKVFFGYWNDFSRKWRARRRLRSFKGNPRQQSHGVLLQLTRRTSTFSFLLPPAPRPVFPRGGAVSKNHATSLASSPPFSTLLLSLSRRPLIALHTHPDLFSTGSNLLPRAWPSLSKNTLFLRTAWHTRTCSPPSRTSLLPLTSRFPLGSLLFRHTPRASVDFPLAALAADHGASLGGALAPPLLDDCGKFPPSAALGYLTACALFPRGTPTANATVT